MEARSVSRRRATAATAATAVMLVACSQTPTRTTTVAPVPVPPPQLYVYPAAGQDPGRLDRDRYQCHLWAVKQSRFDPSLPGTPVAEHVAVVRTGPLPGSGVLAGAFSGAVLGAAVSSPWNTEEGALIGAAAGAMLGAAAESAAASEARRIEEAQRARQSATTGPYGQRADGYRRAMTACLEAGGYTVR